MTAGTAILRLTIAPSVVASSGDKEQNMNDNDSLAEIIAKLIGSIIGTVFKYVCLAWAIAWGIHLASTL